MWQGNSSEKKNLRWLVVLPYMHATVEIKKKKKTKKEYCLVQNLNLVQVIWVREHRHGNLQLRRHKMGMSFFSSVVNVLAMLEVLARWRLQDYTTVGATLLQGGVVCHDRIAAKQTRLWTCGTTDSQRPRRVALATCKLKRIDKLSTTASGKVWRYV